MKLRCVVVNLMSIKVIVHFLKDLLMIMRKSVICKIAVKDAGMALAGILQIMIFVSSVQSFLLLAGLIISSVFIFYMLDILFLSYMHSGKKRVDKYAKKL